MDIEKGSIYNLLNGQCQYIIPVYQRKYSWYADVSIAEKKALMGVQKQLIIDGQQRMTTLSILMIALRDYLKEIVPEDEFEDNITDMVLKNPKRKGEDAYKMLLTDTDKEVMIKLVDGMKISENEDSQIYTNYLYFKRKVAEGILSPEQIYESISKLDIVGIILDKEQGDEPQLIFEWVWITKSK